MSEIIAESLVGMAKSLIASSDTRWEAYSKGKNQVMCMVKVTFGGNSNTAGFIDGTLRSAETEGFKRLKWLKEVVENERSGNFKLESSSQWSVEDNKLVKVWHIKHDIDVDYLDIQGNLVGVWESKNGRF